MLDFEECLLLDADDLTSAVYLSPVQIPPHTKDVNFMFVGIGVKFLAESARIKSIMSYNEAMQRTSIRCTNVALTYCITLIRS